MTLWVDYSFARPSIAEMKAAGVVGVLRYLSPDNGSTHGKILFPFERDQLLGAGFDLALNFEFYQGRCNEGYNSGVMDATTAEAQAKGLGYPQGKTIYFSHDTGVYDWAQIELYFRAIRSTFSGYYKIGCYGSAELCKHLLDLKLADYAWQTLAWSNGVHDPHAVIYQDGTQLFNGGADEDVVSSTDIGSWKDGPSTDWFDMASKQDLHDVLAEFLGDNNHEYLPPVHKKLNAITQQLGSTGPVAAAVDERLAFWLPRLAAMLRTGNANNAFTVDNSGASIDGKGLDGEIAAIVTASIDYGLLAKAVADELHSRLEA